MRMDLPKNRYAPLEEISIRDEVLDHVSGVDFGEVHYIPWVARLLKRKPNGDQIHCHCWDNQSMEGKRGCPDCGGIGSLWTESIIPGYSYYTSQRRLVKNLEYEGNAAKGDDVELSFITPFDIPLDNNDRIYKPVLNKEGLFKYPIEMNEEYHVIYSREYRLDYGRLEYMFAILNRIK